MRMETINEVLRFMVAPNTEVLDEFYSEAYLADMRGANRAYPVTPEED